MVNCMARKGNNQAEVSSFRLILGDSPLIKVLDFLLESSGDFDYSLTDMADKTGISWSTMHKMYPKLVKAGFIKQTRTISRAKMFTLNKEHPLVKSLILIDNVITDFYVEMEAAKQEGKKLQFPKMKVIEPMKIKP